MFDNVLETSVRPQVISDSSSEADDAPIKKTNVISENEDTAIKKSPAKRKLGPAPGPAKRKIVSSESETTPVKKKVIFL